VAHETKVDVDEKHFRIYGEQQRDVERPTPCRHLAAGPRSSLGFVCNLLSGDYADLNPAPIDNAATPSAVRACHAADTLAMSASKEAVNLSMPESRVTKDSARPPGKVRYASALISSRDCFRRSVGSGVRS
jgi:hypothetical protein